MSSQHPDKVRFLGGSRQGGSQEQSRKGEKREEKRAMIALHGFSSLRTAFQHLGPGIRAGQVGYNVVAGAGQSKRQAILTHLNSFLGYRQWVMLPIFMYRWDREDRCLGAGQQARPQTQMRPSALMAV